MKGIAQQELCKKKLFTTKEASDYLGLSPKTLEKWRNIGRGGIPYIKMAGAVRYNIDDLNKYIAEKTIFPMYDTDNLLAA